MSEIQDLSSGSLFLELGLAAGVVQGMSAAY